MADVTFAREDRPVLVPRTDWGAIWAGLFTFVAIFSVFGVLGGALFNSAASAAATTQPVQTLGIGIGIWTIVLSAIAMYIAGRETGRLAGLDGRREGMAHGLIMFGLSVAAVAVLSAAAGFLFSGPVNAAATHNRYILGGVFGGSQWIAFTSLFVGWLGAMIGAASDIRREVSAPRNVRDIRTAA